MRTSVAAGAGVLAGCLGVLGDDGFQHRKWLGHRDGTARFALSRPAAVLDQSDYLSADYREQLEDGGDFEALTGVDPVTVEYSFGADGWYAWSGGFDEDDLSGAVTGDGFERARTHEGYDIYRSHESAGDLWGWAAAVDGATCLFRQYHTDDPTDAVDFLADVVDTRGGDGVRLVEERPAADVLTGELGDEHEVRGIVYGQHDRDGLGFDGLLARGQRARIDGSETPFTEIFVFDSPDDAEDAPAESALGEWRQGDSYWSVATDDVDVSVDGRVVELEGRIPTSEFRGL